MLEELRIRGLGVIDDAVLALGAGFTAVTGETGAGKTMLLTGLRLLFGDRADAGLVRTGYPRAEVEARIRVAPDNPALARALEAGAELDDGALLITRTVSAEGRSRAYLGGRSVPVGLLAELAEHLVTVHGQADQRGLLRPAVQREVVDRFGGPVLASAAGHYRGLFARLAEVRRELDDVTRRRRERAREADVLRLGLAEIAAVAPQPGEETQLRAELARLAHADALRRAADGAHAALTAADPTPDVPDALGLVGTARQSLAAAAGHDPALDALADRLAEASYLLADVAADLGAYLATLEADPNRLAHVQARLAEFATLTRKYADDVDGVLAWAEQAAARLRDLDGDDDRVTALSDEHAGLLDQLADAAARLSGQRCRAAARLTEAVSTELVALAMPHGAVRAEVAQRPDPRGLPTASGPVAFGSNGIDEVELLLVPHGGASPRPLHRGASGGELSRVMLALEVVLAGADPSPVFVFDEVDAGVGGRAAVEVGARLGRLAATAQVLVVTHLPQVAAFADRHVVVRKEDTGDVTATSVAIVDGADRLQELSRMLAGLPDSELGRGHAEELLSLAAAAKAPSPR